MSSMWFHSDTKIKTKTLLWRPSCCFFPDLHSQTDFSPDSHTVIWAKRKKKGIRASIFYISDVLYCDITGLFPGGCTFRQTCYIQWDVFFVLKKKRQWFNTIRNAVHLFHIPPGMFWLFISATVSYSNGRHFVFPNNLCFYSIYSPPYRHITIYTIL